MTLTYRMPSEMPPVVPLRLKVEINSREHFTVLGVRNVPFTMASPWFTGTCTVPTFALEELLGTKLRALYQRRKGRDLFDLWVGLTEGQADPEQTTMCFRKYMEHGGLLASRREFLQNLSDKRCHPTFTADLGYLLPVGSEYDLQAGFSVIERELVARI